MNPATRHVLLLMSPAYHADLAVASLTLDPDEMSFSRGEHRGATPRPVGSNTTKG